MGWVLTGGGEGEGGRGSEEEGLVSATRGEGGDMVEPSGEKASEAGSMARADESEGREVGVEDTTSGDAPWTCVVVVGGTGNADEEVGRI